jgi:hypothetical protein
VASRQAQCREVHWRSGIGGTAALGFRHSRRRLIFLNHSTDYAIDQLGVNAKNVVKAYPRRVLLAWFLAESDWTGAIRSATACPPISIWSEGARGTRRDDVAAIWFEIAGLRLAVGRIGDHERSALVDAKMGSGHVILFGMRPQYRAQSYLTFKLFFNALLYQ